MKNCKNRRGIELKPWVATQPVPALVQVANLQQRGVPTPKEHLVNLYNAASEESKALAYDAMAKALSSPPVVKQPALPVKPMPSLPQEIFMQQMASQVSSMLIQALGMGMMSF